MTCIWTLRIDSTPGLKLTASFDELLLGHIGRAFRSSKYAIFYRVNRVALEIARVLRQSVDFYRYSDE